MKLLSGQLLIASRKLVDPNFFRSVVLLVQHRDEGRWGWSSIVRSKPLFATRGSRSAKSHAIVSRRCIKVAPAKGR